MKNPDTIRQPEDVRVIRHGNEVALSLKAKGMHLEFWMSPDFGLALAEALRLAAVEAAGNGPGRGVLSIEPL